MRDCCTVHGQSAFGSQTQPARSLQLLCGMTLAAHGGSQHESLNHVAASGTHHGVQNRETNAAGSGCGQDWLTWPWKK